MSRPYKAKAIGQERWAAVCARALAKVAATSAQNAESDEKRQASNPKSTANTDIVGGRLEWPSVGPKSTIVRLHWPQDCGSCAV